MNPPQRWTVCSGGADYAISTVGDPLVFLHGFNCRERAEEAVIKLNALAELVRGSARPGGDEPTDTMQMADDVLTGKRRIEDVLAASAAEPDWRKLAVETVLPLEVLIADEAANGEHRDISPSLRALIQKSVASVRAALSGATDTRSEG